MICLDASNVLVFTKLQQTTIREDRDEKESLCG